MNDGKLAYVQKQTARQWLIKTMDPLSYAGTTIGETVPGSEDFALLADGTFLMGVGSKMYAMYPADPQKQWIEVADLAQFGIYNIKRLSVSREGDRIAIVDDRTRRQ